MPDSKRRRLHDLLTDQQRQVLADTEAQVAADKAKYAELDFSATCEEAKMEKISVEQFLDAAEKLARAACAAHMCAKCVRSGRISSHQRCNGPKVENEG